VSLFAIPVRREERAIARNPWVERVVVRRQFPDRVLVDVTERRPCAIINLGSLYYVDRRGVVFKRLVRGDASDYPVVTGLRPADLSTPEGRELLARALELQSLLERDPRFGPKRISEIHVSRNDGVSVITTGDATTIRFGLDNFPLKMESLGKLLRHLEQQNVKVRSIDLEFRNMAVVEPADEADDKNTVGL
jgi:cell division septal protein FtsQ